MIPLCLAGVGQSTTCNHNIHMRSAEKVNTGVTVLVPRRGTWPFSSVLIEKASLLLQHLSLKAAFLSLSGVVFPLPGCRGRGWMKTKH